MRVEGQGMAADCSPAKSEAVNNSVVEKIIPKEKKAKIGLEALSTGKKASIEEIQGAIDEVNQAMKVSNYHVQFKLYKESNDYQVNLIDSQSEEVIKKIPPDYMMELSQNIKETLHKAVGILIDELV